MLPDSDRIRLTGSHTSLLRREAQRARGDATQVVAVPVGAHDPQGECAGAGKIRWPISCAIAYASTRHGSTSRACTTLSRRDRWTTAVPRARVEAADAQIAVLEKSQKDATVPAPISGIVTQKLVDAGEIVMRGMPLVVITDLDHAWANLFVPEPMVPRVAIGQAATVLTDAGGPGLDGKVTFISPRAEFTPRNVQTAEERSKLVYRIKVSVDNRGGVLKVGMPVDGELKLQ